MIAVTLEPASTDKRPLIPIAALFLVVLVRNAWLSDDAYITFRTVDNFVNGYGLTWNVGERVQAYTHPLWMFLLSGVYFFTREAYYTSILLSISLALATLLLFAFGIAPSLRSALLGSVVLLLSKAFVDYSTSGLENPLSHLLLAFFLYLYFRTERSAGTFFLLCFAASLGILNRMDMALIFLPALAVEFFHLPKANALKAAAIGGLPVVLWELFSLLYYGFAFPNTAYAKLNTGIPGSEMALQGVQYLLGSLGRDPLTAWVVLLAIALPFAFRHGRGIPIAVGVLLYLIYVVRIGGDFMSGRFLGTPVLAAVVLLAILDEKLSWAAWQTGMATALVVGLLAPASPLLSDGGYHRDPKITIADLNGVYDERAFYYKHTGLLLANRASDWPNHDWVVAGRQARLEGAKVLVTDSIGFLGYYAGPTVHLVDTYALADPLLARLPAQFKPQWRIGHFSRPVPDGYIETLNSGENELRDPQLALYYDKLGLITRGSLFRRDRLVAIFEMNTGTYDRWIDRDTYRFPSMLRLSLEEVGQPVSEGTPAVGPGVRSIPLTGVQVDLGETSHALRLEISVDNNDSYELLFFNGAAQVGRQTLVPRPNAASGLVVNVLDVPAGAVARGYDTIRLFASGGDSAYYFGHLRLFR